MATLSVRVYAQAAEAAVGHFRACAGEREVHLIVKADSRRVDAIDVELAATPSECAGARLHLAGTAERR